MTLRECYTALHGSYDDAMSRMFSEDFMDHMLKEFHKDENMSILCASVEKGDIRTAFSAAHTLKSLIPNYGFTELSDEIKYRTEKLRAGQIPDNMNEIKASYKLIIDTIQKYKAG